MEEQRQGELKMLRQEKEQLQALILRQTAIMGELEQQLLKVSSNNTVLQNQQQELLETVNNLIHTIAVSSAQGESALQALQQILRFISEAIVCVCAVVLYCTKL